MHFVIDFISRLHISPEAKNIAFEPATSSAASPIFDDGPIAAKVAAIFAPIMESLERIEKLIDMLPDKPTGSPQV